MVEIVEGFNSLVHALFLLRVKLSLALLFSSPQRLPLAETLPQAIIIFVLFILLYGLFLLARQLILGLEALASLPPLHLLVFHGGLTLPYGLLVFLVHPLIISAQFAILQALLAFLILL